MVRLTAKTRRGQNKLDQHGANWHIRKTESWGTLLLESSGKTFQAHSGVAGGVEMQTDWRWVKMSEDKDFIVEVGI